MKKSYVLIISAAMLWIACKSPKDEYVDLRTGKTIEVEKDPVTGVWLNTETKEPVYIYVDTKKNDTIYGKTGAVINGHVVKNNDVYWYSDDVTWDDNLDDNIEGESKIKKDDYKKKVDEDGDIKIKTDGKTIKIDGETGERKVKD